MMPRTSLVKAKMPVFGSGPLGGLGRACARFYRDERGASAIDYALTAGGVALGGTGLTSAIGGEVTGIFYEIEYALCMQVQHFCILN